MGEPLFLIRNALSWWSCLPATPALSEQKQAEMGGVWFDSYRAVVQGGILTMIILSESYHKEQRTITIRSGAFRLANTMSFVLALSISCTGYIAPKMRPSEPYTLILHAMLYNPRYQMYPTPHSGTTAEMVLQKTPGSDYAITAWGTQTPIQGTAYYMPKTLLGLEVGLRHPFHRTVGCVCGCATV